MMTLQNMTTPLRALLPAALMLLAATACEDTLDNPAAHTGNGPALTLVLDNNEDNAGTRTELTGSDATHHVQTVDILIFEGTNDEATYVGTETVDWPQNTVDAQPVNRMTYTLTHNFNANTSYTLLGVGKDDQFDNTYNIDEDQTLGQTYAKLKDGKDQKAIAACEFFTGTVSFTYTKEVQIDDLLMKRRVAGVMLYVTDIPTKIGDQKTARIELCLGEDQKSSVLLKRDLEDKEWREPAGQTALDNSQVLATITLPEANGTDEIYQTDGTPTVFNGGLYILPMNREADAATPTFLIKIYGGDKDETLLKTFVVLNQSEEEENREVFDIRSNYIYSIGTEDEPVSLSDDVILLEVLPFTGMDVDHDFGPARIQAVFQPDFDKENYRFNCINDTFQVRVEPSLFGDNWRINIPSTTTAYNKDFTETAYSTISGSEQMTHWLYILHNDGTVTTTYECTAEEAKEGATITFVILDYAVYRPWGWVNHKWEPTDNDINHINNDVRWIDVTLTTTPAGADGSGTSRVDQMRITQYNTITVDFTHQKYSIDEELDSDDFGPAICGFSRVDWGDRLYPYPTDDYVVSEDPDVTDVKGPDGMFEDKANYIYKSSGWGYFDTSTALISYDDNTRRGSQTDGARNIEHLGKDKFSNNWKGIWKGSAAQRCEHLFLRVENGRLIKAEYDDDQTTILTWYLPAVFELEGLITAAFDRDFKTNPLNANLANNDYWTSTITNAINERESYAAYIVRPLERQSYPLTDATVTYINRGLGFFGEDREAQNDYNSYGSGVYLRPARKFTQYYQGSNGAWTTLPDGQATE